MENREREAICQRTERKGERVRIRNRRTGEVGFTTFCTEEGGTIQVTLENGEPDSWVYDDCEEIPEA